MSPLIIKFLLILNQVHLITSNSCIFIPKGSVITEDGIKGIEITTQPIASDKCSTYQILNVPDQPANSTLYTCEEGDSNGWMYSYIGQDNCTGTPTYKYRIEVNGTCEMSACIGYESAEYPNTYCTGSPKYWTNNIYEEWNSDCQNGRRRYVCTGYPVGRTPSISIYKPPNCGALVDDEFFGGCKNDHNLIGVTDNPCG